MFTGLVETLGEVQRVITREVKKRKEAAEAFEVLSDKQRRERYDR